MHPAFLVPAPCPANLTLPEVQHSRMAEGAVADYLAGLGVAYALKTRQSLGSDWLCFARWCAEEAHVSFPATPATVVAYIEAQAAGHSVATLPRRLATLPPLPEARPVGKECGCAWSYRFVPLPSKT